MDVLGSAWTGSLFAGVFGLCAGSFANVVIYRTPRDGLSVVRPARSFCPACRAPIGWRDNLPVLSWLLLRGRCRACQASIGVRYPAVELLVGGLFAAAWWLIRPVDADSFARLFMAWLLAFAGVCVTLIDLEHLIIPDAITYPGAALGLALSVWSPALHAGQVAWQADAPRVSSLFASLAGLLAGGGSLFLVGQLGNLMLRRRLKEAGVQDAMGWGDVKLMAFAGTLLGAMSVLSAILIGCFLGALAGILMKVWAAVRGQPSPVGLPFGPFLTLGVLAELVRPELAWRLVEALARPA